jgi:uncharacterized membrane protein
MNDHDLDLLVRAADPCPPGSAPDLGDAGGALLEEICAQPAVDRRTLARRRRRRTRHASALRTRLAVSVATAAAMTAVIGAPAIIADHRAGGEAGHRAGTDAGPRVGRDGATGPGPSQVSTAPIRYAAAAVRVARANPRVLVTAPGWKVRSVEGFDPDAGEMTFQLGPDQWRDETTNFGSAHVNAAPHLEVTWYPRDQYDTYRADRAREPHLQQLNLFGLTGQMISYSATDHAVLLPPQGAVFLELRGSDIGDEAAFKSFLADSIEQVDVGTWLEAMPPSVVTARNLDAAVRRVLAGVPLPPGFDASSLDRGLAVDSYQFGARVTGMVACGWIEEWQRARDAGDTAAEQRAVSAMATSRDWAVLHDMDAEGDFPEVVWQYSDTLAAGGRAASPKAGLDGFRGALGCR